MNTKRAKGFHWQSPDKEVTGPFTDLFTPLTLQDLPGEILFPGKAQIL